MDAIDAVLTVVITLVVFALVVVATAFLTMWAWNLVMPAIFGLPALTFLQALAINILLGAIRQTIVTVSK